MLGAAGVTLSVADDGRAEPARAKPRARAEKAGPPKAVLPELPPLSVRFPGWFDEEGCVNLHGDAGKINRMCPPAEPSPLEAVLPRPWRPKVDPEEAPWRSLLGYEGSFFVTDLRAGRVIVLQDTVGISAGDRWRATGMIRNETTDAVTAAVVHAELVGADGATLSTATAPVPVKNIRPGEPAPFTVETKVPTAAVDHVEWSVESKPAKANAAATRQVEITRYWDLPYGDRERLDHPLAGILPSLSDPKEPPYPEIIWGDIKNWGRTAIPKPRMVGLWLAEDGRALRLVTGTVYEGAQERPKRELKPDEMACFVFISNEPPPSKDRIRLALWETPS